MLSSVFTIFDIIGGLVYEHMTVQPVVVQKCDEKNTFLVFTESENIAKICNTLQSIEMWFGHIVNFGCSVATPKQVSKGGQLHQMGREEIMSVEGTSMQLPKANARATMQYFLPKHGLPGHE